jgi:serine/threonine protein kinase
MSRILVVDDDSVVRDHARLCLRGAGHEVQTAANGEEGLRLASPGAFDLIVSDVYMPVLGGFGFTDRLRERDGPGTPPVVFMSSIEDRANYRRAFGLQAADFLIKPIPCEELRRVVRERLEAVVPAVPFPAARVRGFRLLRALGKGASASVFLAVRESTGQECALKIVHLPDEEAEQGTVIERFLSECTILEGIVEPGIARVYEHGVADDCIYIALEYLPGGDLVRELGKPLPVARALDECIQVARALGTIHARGIIHRDVKPGNLMRRADGSLALVDFGIARREEHHLTTVGRMLGTPTYMSPEQFSSARCDARSDVYSLGCLFYQMLTGERAFRADTFPALFAAHTTGPRPQLPRPLALFQPVLDRMLAVDPDARYPEGNSVAMALEGLREEFRRRQRRSDTLSNFDLEI